jgi:hypothetical protein
LPQVCARRVEAAEFSQRLKLEGKADRDRGAQGGRLGFRKTSDLNTCRWGTHRALRFFGGESQRICPGQVGYGLVGVLAYPG